MKRIFTTCAIVLGVLVIAAPEVRADPPRWGVSFGFGRDGAHVGFQIGGGHGHRSRLHVPPPRMCLPPPPPVHIHRSVAIVRDVWVPARYENVFVGYDRFGHPVYRTVCVSPGHHERVVVGHRCSGCNRAL